MKMSTFFRRPSDSSSSEDESSENRENIVPIAEDTLLSKINTLESGPSAAASSAEETAQVPPSSTLTRSGTNDQLRDLLLHSLLEDKALKDTADRMGKSITDPDVQQTAKATYQGLAQRFSHVLDHTYASDEMKHQRATAFEGIDRATRAQMTGLAAEVNLTTAGASHALIAQPTLTFTGAAQQVATNNLNQMLGLHTPIPSFLQGIRGLHTDRYERDFSEIELVGKGGYGKVYKVKHNLDNSFYAVKRIAVSYARMQNIKREPQAIECLLEEVRSLARLEHANIVRYHNAWLEYKDETPGNIIRPTQLLEDATSEYPSTSFGNTYDEPGQYSDAGIVFEDSDTGAGAQESIPFGKQATRRKDRRASEVTVATISSTLSHTGMGGAEENEDVESAEEVEDDEDVEEISRTVDESSSMMSNSDMPMHLVTTSSRFTTGPSLTLNVQMSLYESNLHTFLSSEQPPPTHCYHTCISLEIMASILTGVEYLHARGIVHRDLKPANIFLALSTERIPPAGSVPLHTCRQCPGREFLYVTPRIGDFGLVTALAGNNATATAPATFSAAATKPVGTEFYRPPTGGLTASEKLDVFSLGVVTFELLRRFETRMERIDALSKLRHGELPEGFGDEMGLLMGREVEKLLIGMLREDEEVRFGCAAVRKGIEDIVFALKG